MPFIKRNFFPLFIYPFALFSILVFASCAGSGEEKKTGPVSAKTKCSAFKTGKFSYYVKAINANIRVHRTATHHTEYRTPKFYVKSRIKWLDKCTFSKKRVKITDPHFNAEKRERMMKMLVIMRIKVMNENQYLATDYRKNKIYTWQVMTRIPDGDK